MSELSFTADDLPTLRKVHRFFGMLNIETDTTARMVAAEMAAAATDVVSKLIEHAEQVT